MKAVVPRWSEGHAEDADLSAREGSQVMRAPATQHLFDYSPLDCEQQNADGVRQPRPEEDRLVPELALGRVFKQCLRTLGEGPSW